MTWTFLTGTPSPGKKHGGARSGAPRPPARSGGGGAKQQPRARHMAALMALQPQLTRSVMAAHVAASLLAAMEADAPAAATVSRGGSENTAASSSQHVAALGDRGRGPRIRQLQQTSRALRARS